MAENARGIIALNAVVTGTDAVRNLRTQLDAIIKTGGGTVKLDVDMGVRGAEGTKQAIAAVGRSFDMLNEKVSASLRFLESAVIRYNTTMASLANKYPGELGIGTRRAAATRLTGQISRLTGLPQKEVSGLISLYKRAEILTGIISNTNRYDPSREQTALFERVNRQLESYTRRARNPRFPSPVIPMTLSPAETQEAAMGALQSIGQELGLLLPRRSLRSLPPQALRNFATAQGLGGSTIFGRIVSRLGQIEGGKFTIPPDLVNEFDYYRAKFGRYPTVPRTAMPGKVSVPTTGRLITSGAPRLSSYLAPAFTGMNEMRAIRDYNPLETLRTPKQYMAMLFPEVLEQNRRFTELISSPLAMESLRRRGSVPRSRNPLRLDPTGGSEDILADVAAQTARMKAAGQATGAATGGAAAMEDPFLKYFKNDPFIRGMFRGQSKPDSEYIRYLARIRRRDIFQGFNERFTPFRGFGPGLNEEEYIGQLMQHDMFQGGRFGMHQYPPGGGGGGPPNKAPRGGGGGMFGRFSQRFGGLAMYLGAGALLYPISGALYSTVERARELEVVLTRVKAIYGSRSLSDQLEIRKNIVDSARQMSTDLIATARSAELLAQEGMDPKTMRMNLRAISQGSIGMGIGQEGLANFIIAVRNATLHEGGRVEGPELTNLLAAFYRRGAVSPQNLMTSIQQVLPSLEVFEDSKDSVKENIALIGAITSSVARRTSFTGSQVSNAIRYFIARFGSPQTARNLERYSGIEFGTKESGGQQLRPFRDIMEDISSSYNKFLASGQTSRAQAILREGFGVRQVGVGQNIMSLESWSSILNMMNEALKDNSSATMLATESQRTLNAALERMSTRFTELGLGVVDFFKKVAVGVGYLVMPDTVTGRDVGLKEWLKNVYATSTAHIFSMGMATPFMLLNRGSNVPGSPILPSGDSHMIDFLQRGSMGPAYSGGIPNSQSMLGAAIRSQFPGSPSTEEQSRTRGETAPLWDPTGWQSFYRYYKNITGRISGQAFTARLLSQEYQDPRRELNQLVNLMDRFYSAINGEDRGINPKTGRTYTIEEWISSIDPKLYDEVMPTYRDLLSRFPEVRRREAERVHEDINFESQNRIDSEQRRASFVRGRMSLKLQRAFGKRGLSTTIGELLSESLTEVSASRAFDITQQNAAAAASLGDLRRTDAYRRASPEIKAEMEYDLSEKNRYQLLTINNKYNELELEAQINAQYETRLKYLKQVEELAGGINDAVRNALFNMPGKVGGRGVLGNILGSIIAPSTSSLYSSVLQNVNLFGREGLFPGVGTGLNNLVGPPPDLTGINIPIIAPGTMFNGMSSPAQTQEQYRKAQIEAQKKAIAIALASTLGSAAGGGGQGAQIGGQLGALGGMAAGAELGSMGGPIGAVVGGIIGGLLGGLFDKKKKKPEIEALEIIARNSGEQVTLLENANRLLELQSIAFNIPTGFSLPAYNPGLSNAMFGGQQPVVSNEINVEVNVGVAGSSAGEIGQVVAQAISDRLNNEYRNAGRYVSRSIY